MPVLVDPGAGADRQFWLVDGKIRGHVRHVIKPKDFQALAEALTTAMSICRWKSTPCAYWRETAKVRPELAKKILDDNPARFYGIH